MGTPPATHRPRHPRLLPLAVLIGAACAGAFGPAGAVPTQAQWTAVVLPAMGPDNTALAVANGSSAAFVAGIQAYEGAPSQGLGWLASLAAGATVTTQNFTHAATLGGTTAGVLAVNSAGVGAGRSTLGGDSVYHATRFDQAGTRAVDLGTLGGSVSTAYAINDNGWLTGDSQISGNASLHAFASDGAKMVDLGTLGGSYSRGQSINNNGVVAGAAQDSRGIFRPFVYRDGQMQDLGTLGGASGWAYGINNAGAVVGSAGLAQGGAHAALFSGGTVRDLGTLGGRNSAALAVNDSGLIVGQSDTGAGGAHAFLLAGGKMLDLNAFNGLAARDLVYTTASSISANGSIAGEATSSDGHTHAFVAVLDTQVWAGGASGRWTDGSNWAYGIVPSFTTRVVLDPASAVTVKLDSPGEGALYARELQVGGDGAGAVTAELSGALFITNPNAAVSVKANGTLGGRSFIDSAAGIANQGRIVTTSLDTSGAIVNHGLLAASGDLAATAIVNRSGGTMRVQAGQTLALGNFKAQRYADITNEAGGLLDLRGTLDARNATITNRYGGVIRFDGGTLKLNHDLHNNGTLQVGRGGGTLDGGLTNLQGSIVLDGNTLAVSGAVTNHGTIAGGGRLDGRLLNADGGTVRLSGNDTLVLGAATSSNLAGGRVDMSHGGRLSVDGGSFDNDVGGTVVLNAGWLSTRNGFSNSGTVFAMNGGGRVSGRYFNESTGATYNSGGRLAFDGEVVNAGLMSASGGARSVYRGEVVAFGVFETTDASSVHRFEGRVRANAIGSPLAMGNTEFAGELALSDLPLLPALRAANGGFASHAAFAFQGSVRFDTTSSLTLDLQLLHPGDYRAGDVIDLFSYGEVPQGRFGRLTLPTLGTGLTWDTSGLYSVGELRVAAVPEPKSVAMLAAGLALLAVTRRRRATAR